MGDEHGRPAVDSIDCSGQRFAFELETDAVSRTEVVLNRSRFTVGQQVVL